ncbi:DUF928 domain-containing protein [Nostoc linckia]|jgi:hypothetical protein|uniref:DUF928 domain-containing protein n=1 Tax=Nostoc linckia TaxID=92942 RepID=UPI000BFFAFDA|nr:DUF928 domain-containing protein [Nostoc linckia]
MSKLFCVSKQLLTSKLLLSLTLILSLILTNTALADYKPPKNPSSPKTATGSNGTRTNECTGNGKTTLTALAPFSYVGQTASLQPTFAWFVPNSPTREIKFSLYRYEDGKPKSLYTKQLQSSPGIMQFSLINEKMSLSVGQQYLWQVALLCNPNHPSENLIVRAEIKVVEIPPSLKNALSQTKELMKRSELYAENGLWYDALAESPNKTSTLILLSQLTKIEVEKVNEIPESADKKYLQQQILQFQQIVDFEKLLN